MASLLFIREENRFVQVFRFIRGTEAKAMHLEAESYLADHFRFDFLWNFFLFLNLLNDRGVNFLLVLGLDIPPGNPPWVDFPAHDYQR